MRVRLYIAPEYAGNELAPYHGMTATIIKCDPGRTVVLYQVRPDRWVSESDERSYKGRLLVFERELVILTPMLGYATHE